ncbi:MAG: precorrin-8X methylmutase, partial [Clostridia bacterium]|nr:precorrin-8X methylmutase [Clostridia bacterium]
SSRRFSLPYVSAEAAEIIQMVEAETGDSQLAQSLQFSPTALTHIKRMLAAGGTIVADTQLVASDVDQSLLGKSDAKIECFIEDPNVLQLAEIRHTTRAEIAVDLGLSLQGPKLMVVSSAPAALNRILARRKQEPLSDVCVLAAPAGFASVVQLKEKLRESDMAYIVVRGKKGGTAQTATILNAILRVIQKNANE